MAGLYEADLVGKIPGYMQAVLDAVSEEAAFLAMVKHQPAVKNKLAEWSVQLPKRRGDPTGTEGADKTTGFEKRVPKLLRVYGQRVESDGWQVTDLAENTDTNVGAGAKEAARQKALDASAGLLAVQDLLLSTQETASSADAEDGKDRTRSVHRWLDSTEQAVLPVDSSIRPTTSMRYTSTLAAFTEAAFKAMLSAASEQVDKPVNLTGLVGIDLANTMAAWNILVPYSSNVQATPSVVSQASSGVMERKVSFFRWHDMEVKTIVQRRLYCDASSSNAKTAYTTRSGFFIDPGMWRIDWLEPWHHMPLLDQGGGPRGFHKGWCRLVCKNPMGQCTAYIGS